MNEKFFDLSREKQDRMINGAIEVFAKNGFKHASTDDMVKAVDVSKGLWFHYFGSKLGLYDFVYGYSVKYIILELSTVMDEDVKDFFEIVKQIEFTKMRITKNYPYMMQFIERASRETDQDVIEHNKADYDIITEKFHSLFKNGEIANVEEKANREKIKKMVQYTIAGIEKDKSMKGETDPEATYREIRNYLDFMKNLVENQGSPKGKEGSSISIAAS